MFWVPEALLRVSSWTVAAKESQRPRLVSLSSAFQITVEAGNVKGT